MENDKALIVYTAIGPTFRNRVNKNILTNKSLKYFDVLVYTDYVEDFKWVEKNNIIVHHIDDLRDDWSKANEIIPKSKRDLAEYIKEITDSNLKYPYSINRYVLNLKNILKYKAIMFLDCDVEVHYDDNTITNFYSALDSITENTVIGHNYYDFYNKEHVVSAVKHFSEKLNLPVPDTFNSCPLNYGPIRIYKFINQQSIDLFLNTYTAIVKEIYESKFELKQGSWTILAEPILAILYRLLNVKVLVRSGDYYCDNNNIRCNTYAEDRFWYGWAGWEFKTNLNSVESFVRENYNLLKQFFERNNPFTHWPYEKYLKPAIVTLTTIPTRLIDEHEQALKSCILSLINQNYDNYEIHFNIPDINKITGDAYIIPQWLQDLSTTNSKLKLFRVEDLGAITKLVPTIRRVTDMDTVIITVDDDLVYHPDMVKEQINNQINFPGCAVGYDGLGLKNPPIFNDIRDHYVVSVNGNYEVKMLQAYKSVSYLRKYFEDDYFTDFVGKSWADDLVNSSYMGYKKIKKIVTYHPSDPVIKTEEEWRSLGGVLTFPVIRHTHHESLEGCNIMRHNKIDDNGKELYKHID